MVRDALESRPFEPPHVGLPAPAIQFLESPPPVSSWTSEVLFVAMSMAIYDRDFGGSDLAGYERWVMDFNLALFRSPLYRVLFAMLTPRRLMLFAVSRWSAFHRASALTLRNSSSVGTELELAFPPHLFPLPMLHAFGAAWCAAGATAGATEPRSEILEHGPEHARYRVTWR